ncbi:unnamed protein product [Trichobilharzia szidati]|nr:unnamed protein product [Trichobilharzia szidati]
MDYNNCQNSDSDYLSEAALFCSACKSREVFGILTTCLHLTCQTCSELMHKDDVYLCTVCSERSTKVINNPNLCRPENVNKSPTCNWCHDNGEQTKSVGRCEDCGIWLCGECLKGHNRMPPLRNHNITVLSKSEHMGSLRCEAHPNEALECFCEACGMLTCRDCQLSVHRDHGSHRWVGEKAVQLKIPLEERVQELKKSGEKLFSILAHTNSARICTPEDSFMSSVEKTRQDIKSRTASLIDCIRVRSECLLNELDKKMDMYAGRLQDTEALVTKLQEQINFVSAFSNHLINNVDNDPASLVQLYEIVKLRLDLLQIISERILNDSASLSDSVDQKLKDQIKESSLWTDNVVGWRTVVNTRALFLGNWDAEELCRYSGTIAWLPKQTDVNIPHKNSDQIVENQATVKVENGLAKADNMTTNQSTTDTNDFLDSLAELDGDKLTSRDNGESLLGSAGCAICFGVGLLAHCGQCNRAYHLDCHLPRIDSISLTSDWLCVLCADATDETPSTTQSLKNGFSWDDYMTGCRILTSLLVHSDAVHFTASICPSCSISLISPRRSVPHCSAGHLYHRLAELRLFLEETVSSVSNGHCDPASSLNSCSGQSRYTCFSDWLIELDNFLSDAAKETEVVYGSTKGSLQAARQLRSHLKSLVHEYRPEFEAILYPLATSNEPVNDYSVDAPICTPDSLIALSPAPLKIEVTD